MRTQPPERFARSSITHTTKSRHKGIPLPPTFSTTWQDSVKSQRAKEGHLPTKGSQVQVLAGTEQENRCWWALGIRPTSSATGDPLCYQGGGRSTAGSLQITARGVKQPLSSELLQKRMARRSFSRTWHWEGEGLPVQGRRCSNSQTEDRFFTCVSQ